MILEQNTYESVKNMLESEDPENMVLGLECIENADFASNIIYILFLFKETNLPVSTWYNNAPKTSNLLCELLKKELKDVVVTYKIIKRTLVVYKSSWADYEFFFERYAEHLRKDFNGNFDKKDEKSKVIKTLQIQITYDNNES